MAATVFGASTQKKGQSFPNPGELCSGSVLAQRPEDTSYFITGYVKPQVSFQRSSFRLDVRDISKACFLPYAFMDTAVHIAFPVQAIPKPHDFSQEDKVQTLIAYPKMIIPVVTNTIPFPTN